LSIRLDLGHPAEARQGLNLGCETSKSSYIDGLPDKTLYFKKMEERPREKSGP